VATGWLHTLNFPFPMIAFVVSMNWLYSSTGRLILIPIVCHITANFANDVLMTHPTQKHPNSTSADRGHVHRRNKPATLLRHKLRLPHREIPRRSRQRKGVSRPSTSNALSNADTCKLLGYAGGVAPGDGEC